MLIQSIPKDSFLNTVHGNNIKSYQAIESDRIQKYNALAEKINDSTLLIRLKNGTCDTISNDAHSLCYYIDYAEEIQSHLVKIFGDNYVSVIAINDSTGIKKDLD